MAHCSRCKQESHIVVIYDRLDFHFCSWRHLAAFAADMAREEQRQELDALEPGQMSREAQDSRVQIQLADGRIVSPQEHYDFFWQGRQTGWTR